jgi:hypothetical protein
LQEVAVVCEILAADIENYIQRRLAGEAILSNVLKDQIV